MNSTLETPLQLIGIITTTISLIGTLDTPIVQCKEVDNEYGGKTAIIG